MRPVILAHCGAILLAACGSGAESDSGPAPCSAPGIVLHVAYAPGPTCDVYDGTVTVAFGAVTEETDPPGVSPTRIELPWPAGVVAGTSGTIELAFYGQWDRATGSATIDSADPGGCVDVSVIAACTPILPDAGP